MTRLRGVVEVSRFTIEPDTMPPLVDHYSIPALDIAGEPDQADRGTIDSHKLVLHGGEVLVSRLNPRKPRVHKVPPNLSRFSVASTEFVPLRALAIDTTYLRYLLLSETVRQQLDSHVRSATRSHQRVDASDVLNLLVPVEDTGEQQRIADFLDDRVARIDQIITARRAQRSALTTRLSSAFGEVLRQAGLDSDASVETGWSNLPRGWRQTSLGRVLRQLTNGFVGPTRDILTDDGVRYIQSTHVKNGRIEFERRPFFVSEEWHSTRPRIHLQPRDILIVQTGDIGQVALVPEDFGAASCHALLIARADEDLVSAAYLFEHLRSDFGNASMLARATGALHPHLEAGVKSCPVAIPPVALQEDVVIRVGEWRSSTDAWKATIDREVELLAEYKKSLITAAVTGEIDVTTAGSGIQG